LPISARTAPRPKLDPNQAGHQRPRYAHLAL
jgi:hypothetical protein